MLCKKHILHALITERAECLVNRRSAGAFVSFLSAEAERKKAAAQKRGADIVKCKARGQIQSIEERHLYTNIVYNVHLQALIKQRSFFYIEEEIEARTAVFYEDELISDEPVNALGKEEEQDLRVNETIENIGEVRYSYNRLSAVRYAETWWNQYNPKYKKFDNDCTNFISQCVHEGGAPMRGYPHKGKGWWMQNNSWSYSWSVANAFYTYLKHSSAGLRAKQLAEPQELLRGDVILYDFEGDGKWNHATIVVAKDANGMPLVNAHTYNSRMRYWAYEDSTAYTPNIQYAFFHIVN